jgi:hypothetical protein
MRYLYGSKRDRPQKIVATFDSEQQLLAYVRWAILESSGDAAGTFEQGSALASYSSWEQSKELLTNDDANSVIHNPSPGML